MNLNEHIFLREEILKLLESSESLSGSEQIAAEFAGLCMRINERLGRVREHMRSGRMVEAMVESESVPDLLTLCEALQFPETAHWHQKCEANGWSTAPPIDTASLQALQQLAKDALSLQSLQKALRNAAREKNTRRSIWILRKLMALEPDCASHATDLESFERRRLQEIEQEAAEVLSQGDEAGILLLSEELQASGWLTEVPPGLRENICGRAKQIQDAKTLANLTKLIGEVSAAYAAGDWKRAVKPAGRIQALLAASEMEVPQDLLREWEDDLHWLEACRQDDQKEKDFRSKCGVLQEKVSAGVADESESLLRELRLMEMPVPETLEEQAELLIENCRVAQQRRTKRVAFLSAAVLICLAAGAFAFMREKQIQERTKDRAAYLDSLIAENHLSGLTREQERLVREEPSVSRRPEITQRFAKIPAIAENEQIREEQFQRRLATLSSRLVADMILLMPADDYADLAAEIGNEVEQLRQAYARTPQERNALMQQEQRWMEIQGQRNDLRRGAWRTWDASFQPLLSELESLQNRMEEAAFFPLLEETLSLFSSAPEPHSDVAAETMNSYRSRLERIQGLLSSQQEHFASILAATDLQSYFSEIARFTQAYGTHPQAEHMRELLVNQDLYLAFLIHPLQAEPSNPFWGGLVLRQAALATDPQRWGAIRSEVVEWGRDDRLVNIRKLDVTTPRGDRFSAVIEGGSQVRTTFGQTEVNIFVLEQGDRRNVPSFERRPVNNALLSEATLMPHTQVLDRLIASVRTGAAANGYHVLAGAARDLLMHEDVPPLLKLELGADLMRLLSQLAPEAHRTLYQSVLAQVSQADRSINWLCFAHPQYRVLEARAAVLVGNMRRALDEVLSVNHWLLADRIHMANPPVLAGFWPFEGTGIRHAPQTPSQELWVIRRGATAPELRIAAVREEDQLHWLIDPIPGEPLFAPGHGWRTRRIFQELQNRGAGVTERELQNDPAWPIDF